MRRFYRNAYLALGATLLFVATFGLAECSIFSKTQPKPHTFGTPAPAGNGTYVAPVIDADHGSLATGPGHVSNIHCVLSVLGDAGGPLYVMLFDSSSSSQPSPGTVPIYGGVSGGMVSIGNDVSYADTTVTYGTVIKFTSGLLVALSSTADTYSAPPAGVEMRCDARLGS